MKIVDKKNKQERLEIVIDICKKLRSFPASTYFNTNHGQTIDLYNSNFPAISQVKQVFNDYINQDDSHPSYLRGLSGKIKFPEIERTIEYILPIRKHTAPLFVLKANNVHNN